MAGSYWDTLQSTVSPLTGGGMVAPQQPQSIPAPQPTGTGNLVTSALGSGIYGGAADLANAVQAGAKLVGADNFANQAAQFAQRQRETAATYATPENENASVFSPRGLAYRVLQGLPMVAGGLGAAALAGPEAIPAAIGATAFGLPFAIGQNVDALQQAHGPLTQGGAARAIGFGFPEAAIGSLPAERAVGRLFGGVASQGFAHEAAKQAVAQAAAGAGQSYIAQQVADPNRPLADRAQGMIDAALTGGVTGALMGTGIHAFAKTPPQNMGEKELFEATNPKNIGAPRAVPVEPAPAPPPTQEAPIVQPTPEAAGTVREAQPPVAPPTPAPTPAPESAAPVVPPAPVDQPKAVTDLQTAIETAKRSIEKLLPMDVPDTGSDVHDQHVSKEWIDGVTEQGLKLHAIGRALKSGDVTTLSSLPDQYFDTPLWTNKKLSKQQQDALETHADLEQDVMDAVRKVAPRVQGNVADLSAPTTPLDTGIRNTAQSGESKDVFQHIADNGSNGQTKKLAQMLLDHGVNPDIEIGSAPSNQRAVNQREGESLNAAYDPDANKISLYRNDNLEQLALHEGFHAGTMKAIAADGPAAKAMGQIYDRVKALSPDNDANGLRDVNEFTTEAFTNDDFRDYLRSLPADQGKTTLWQKFKNVVGGIFGASGSKQTMLDQVLDTGRQLLRENQTASVNTPQGMNDRIQGMVQKMGETKQRVDQEVMDTINGKATNMAPAAWSLANGWTHAKALAALWGKFSKGLPAYVEASERGSLQKEASSRSYAASTNLGRDLSPAGKKAIGEIVVGAHGGYNFRQTEAEYRAANPDATPEMIRTQRGYATRYANLAPAERAAIDALTATNEMQVHHTFATDLHELIKSEYGGKIALPEDPSDRFRFTPELHDKAEDGRDYWAGAMAARRTLAEQHINEQELKASVLEADAKASQKEAGEVTPAVEKAQAKAEELRKGVEDLKSLLEDYDDQVKEMKRVPYFHMGRDGGYFASGHLALGDDGKPSPQAMAALQDAMNKKGYGSHVINQHLESPVVYARLENPDDAARLQGVFDSLGEGVISRTASGPIDEVASMPGGMPKYRQKLLANMEARLRSMGEGLDDKTQAVLEAQIADMRREVINTSPASSANRVDARRKGIQAYSDDWLQNAVDHNANVARMLAKKATLSDMSAATLQMRKDVQEMNGRKDVNMAQRTGLNAAIQEVLRQTAESPNAKPNSAISAINSTSHMMELGFSVPYGMMLHLQNYTLGLPRLGSEIGFVGGAKGLAEQTIPSLEVLRMAGKGQDAASFGLRQSELAKSKVLTPQQIDTLMQQQAMGTLNHGAYSSNTTHVEGTGLFAKVRKWAAQSTLYMEMQPRVQMILAAEKAWRANTNNIQARYPDMHGFIKKMVDRSQLPWDLLSTPRQLTANSTAGQLGPLLNKFMGYQLRLTNELMQTIHEGLSADTKEEKAAAWKFLGGHMAATAMLAGTMGLPMVGVFASVFDKMADLATDKDDWDIAAQYRNYLSHMFGKDAGEAIARGAPRLFGLDFSHMGDEKLLPGSSAALMLTEKRKWEDAEKDWAKSEAGAPLGMLGNFIAAGRDFANGDYLNGAQKFVPEVFRGPVEALRLGLYGYRDKSGYQLPIKANTRDMLLAAMGLEPEKEAEYGEAKKVLTGEQTLKQLRKQNITQHLALEMNRGDQSAVNYWLGQSAQFQQDHPGELPPVSDLRRYMMQHARSAAIAQSMGTPTGLRPRDFTGRGMVDFANLPQ